MRQAWKYLFNAAALVLMTPLGLLCWLEGVLGRGSEYLFCTCAQTVSLLPGMPGSYLRKAFYYWTLESCSLDCFIGFGTIFTHRATRVERNVFIGLYAIIGSSKIGRGSLVGSRSSIISGMHLHEEDGAGGWTGFNPHRVEQIEISPQVWIGEGAILLADVGQGSAVSAGAVVSSGVPAYVLVAGNPARFVRRLSYGPSASATAGVTSPTLPALHSEPSRIEGRNGSLHRSVLDDHSTYPPDSHN